MALHSLKSVRPDAKGRITLGELAAGVSSFSVFIDKQSRIILEPHVEIPAREKWLFNNKAALQQVKQGLEDVAAGRTRYLGSFVGYVDDDEESAENDL